MAGRRIGEASNNPLMPSISASCFPCGSVVNVDATVSLTYSERCSVRRIGARVYPCVLLYVWHLSELNSLHPHSGEICLSEPALGEVYARQVSNLQVCRVELAARHIRSRNSNTSKIGSVESYSCPNQDRDGVRRGLGCLVFGLG